MSKILTTVLQISLGLLMAFLILSTLIIPFFRTTYEEGFGSATRDDSTDLVNEYCTTKGSITACN